MIQQFTAYCQQHSLILPNDQILVAISGGADSMALWHLLKSSGRNVSLAHCNFSLRGSDSDEDERFVRQLALQHNSKAHFITFATREYAAEKKISIEMAARELRYQWFESLCTEFGYTKIATGHHLNDAIETTFLNMARGTGIRGLTGIAPKNGKIIRPILFATRQQIETYCQTEGLTFRHDASNDSDEYQRNRIRHNIIPEFKKMNPSFEETFRQNMNRWNQALQIYEQSVQNQLEQLVIHDGNRQKISIEKLISSLSAETLLFEFLSTCGFSTDNIAKAQEAFKKESGRTFFSETHQLLIDREFLILEPLPSQNEQYLIRNLNDFANLPIMITAKLEVAQNYTIKYSHHTAQLDAEKVSYPLTIRHWKTGDAFYPLGMQQNKKLSDFFTDMKLDLFTKDKVWILEQNGQIIWIIGYRIDDRFKVTSKTKQVLVLTLQE